MWFDKLTTNGIGNSAYHEREGELGSPRAGPNHPLILSMSKGVSVHPLTVVVPAKAGIHPPPRLSGFLLGGRNDGWGLPTRKSTPPITPPVVPAPIAC